MKQSFAKGLLILGAVALISHAAYADHSGWHFTPGKSDPNSQYHFRLPGKFQDDITSDQNVSKIQLTHAQKHQALVWNISSSEEQRYVALMQNRSGFYYGQDTNHQVSPVEVLGMNARTNEERVKYASQDAKQQFQHLAKYLSFVAEYNKQAAKLSKSLNLPVVRKFDYAKFSPYNYKPVSLQSGDKLMLFVGLDNEVKPIVSSLMGSIIKNPSIQLNIFFVGKAPSVEAINHWASSQNIPPNMVKKGEITLNFDHGKFETLGHLDKPPVLLLVRDGQTRNVNLGGF